MIEIAPGVESYHIGLLNNEQNHRVKMAIDDVVKAAGATESKNDFVLRVYRPEDEEEVVSLEKAAKEFSEVLKAAILKAESDARSGEELGSRLGHLSLFNGTEEKWNPSLFSGRLLLSSIETYLGVWTDDENIAGELERLLPKY
jgi:hypothetical protein